MHASRYRNDLNISERAARDALMLRANTSRCDVSTYIKVNNFDDVNV